MAQTITKNSSLILRPREVRKLFDLSSYLADLTEEWLESNGLYNREFIKGLKESEEDIKKGRIKKAKSLLKI